MEDTLKEECWKPQRMGVGALACFPPVHGVDHVGVGGHVLGGQPPVPTRGESDLGSDASAAELGPCREPGTVLLRRVGVTQTLVVDIM